MNYDEEAVLTQYVWDHYEHRMTELEQRVGRAILGRAKAAVASSPEMASLLNNRWGLLGDTEVDATLAEGPEAFRRRVSRRLLAELAEKMFVNRCPSCKRVARTPNARQCFWCGHDWHQGHHA